MFFQRLFPIKGSEALPDIQEDFRKSKRLEKYRIGNKALYFPSGFRWNYLPLSEITDFRQVTRLIESENGVAPFAMEVQSLRLFYHGSSEVLEIEKEKSVRLLEAVLRDTADAGGDTK